MKQARHTNQLINESSPYLLQHAHNPVDWHPWNRETLDKAKKEDKMILVSIGYSACHWCHVMERESFEDEDVAARMNANFICIKVDREERPDVDQVYMDAVQIISGRGGWPLNCFALPDGRPFWGATYFQRDQWIGVLQNVVHLFQSQRNKLEQQAQNIHEGIRSSSFISPEEKTTPAFSKIDADEMAFKLVNRVDREHGGFKGAPKFPMPNNFLFLLRYYYFTKNPEVLEQVTLTLEKMASGGIYDQVGGGFSRYSVDDHWHVPHFEKMLYDNAQLVTLYSEAYRITENPRFEEVIRETLEFVKRELTSPEAGFYSALDADSEGEEGKFYTWTKAQFEAATGEDSNISTAYFGINNAALWEDGKHVLIRAVNPAELAKQLSLPSETVKEALVRSRKKLLKSRSQRIRPGLDDKQLTSWNALMLKGYLDAYRALGEKDYLQTALQNARYIKKNKILANGQLYRNYKNSKSTIKGFLDDYAFLIEAYISLYECTLDEIWVLDAKKLLDFVLEHFYDDDSGMFFYTSNLHDDTITRKMEVTDNVIPASASSLASGMFRLGLLFEEKKYSDIASGMLQNLYGKMVQYPSAFSNWGILLLHKIHPFHTVVITGPDSGKLAEEMRHQHHPGLLFAGGVKQPSLPITKNRWSPNESKIYVCTGSECRLPVNTVQEVLDQL